MVTDKEARSGSKIESSSRSVIKLKFIDAAALLYSMGVRSSYDFRNLCDKKERPPQIPAVLNKYYKEFTTWDDFRAIGKKASESGRGGNCLNYDELKGRVKEQGIKTQKEFVQAVTDGLLGPGTTSKPEQFYPDSFEGWGSFLAPKNKFISYEAAREVVRTFVLKSTGENLKTSGDWRAFCREGKRPPFIPALPDRDYPDFVSWQHFLVEK